VIAMLEHMPSSATDADSLRLAAHIAHPESDVNLAAVDPEALKRAATLLEAQKVSFIPIAKRFGSAIDGTALAGFAARDLVRYQMQREEFERIRRALEAERVSTMVFKSTGLAPSFHYLSSNLDILVPDGCARTGRRILTEMGYVELLNVEEPRKLLFRRFTGDGSSFAFHMHEVVGWGVPFLDNGPVWSRARHPVDDPAILIPGPSEGLLVTLAHWFYEDKALSLGNLFLTANALRTLDEALAEPAVQARRRGWEEGFWGAICIFDEAWKRLFDEPLLSADQRGELERAPARYADVRERILPLVSYGANNVAARIPFKANKVVYYRKVMRDHGRPIERKLVDVMDTLLWAVRWKLHVRSQPALLVTLSGCDGSGKSLQAELLRGAFDTCDVRVRTVWARGASSKGAGAFMRAGKKLLGGGSAGSRAPDSTADATAAALPNEAERFKERRRRLRNPVARWVFSVVFATDLVWPYVVQTRRAMAGGNVVICDRYICDALVDYALFTGTDPANPPLALKVLHTMIPRPQVAILLDVDPAEALRRKPEEGSTEHLAVARRMFLDLATARRMTIIEGNSTADEVQRDITHAALTEFYTRYGTIINWLLRSNPGQLNPRES
jgi:thymidylate kinase